MSRRILAVSWTMPPLVFPRSLQIKRLLKGLSARGWKIDVLTVHPADVAGTSDPGFARLYEGYYNLHYVRTGEDVVVTPLAQRIKRRLDPPEDYGADNFMRRGLAEVLSLTEKNDYAALVTFAQPWVDHLLGLAVKKQRPQLPWLAHFSDPWADNPFETGETSRRAAALRDEAAVVTAADAVAFVSEETRDLVLRKYDAQIARKAFVLPHAFDADLKQALPPYPSAAGQMRIVYTGSIYPGKRTPDVVLRALARVNELPGARDQIALDFVGYAPEEYPRMLEGMGLFGQVRFLGHAGYMTALAAASAASALLLIDAAADVSVFLPSKIVDYLMFDKPILGITPLAGASAELLRQFGHRIAAPDDEDAVYGVLRDAFLEWQSGKREVPEPSVARTRYDLDSVAGICHERLLQLGGVTGATG
jgi:hypothetical protein